MCEGKSCKYRRCQHTSGFEITTPCKAGVDPKTRRCRKGKQTLAFVVESDQPSYCAACYRLKRDAIKRHYEYAYTKIHMQIEKIESQLPNSYDEIEGRSFQAALERWKGLRKDKLEDERAELRALRSENQFWSAIYDDIIDKY